MRAVRLGMLAATVSLCAGCATTVPTEFNDSMVKINYTTAGFGVPEADKLKIKNDAVRLCSVYGKHAVYISEECAKIDVIRCATWDVTFACTEIKQPHCRFDEGRERSRFLDNESLCVPDSPLPPD